MGKISELQTKEVSIDDISYLIKNEGINYQINLIDVMDKYAIEFAYYLTEPNICTGHKSVEELLQEFKEQYFDK